MRPPKLGGPQNFKNLYYISPLLVNSSIKIFFFQPTASNSPLKYTIKFFFQAHQQQPTNTNSCPQLYSTPKFFFSLSATRHSSIQFQKKKKKKKNSSHVHPLTPSALKSSTFLSPPFFFHFLHFSLILSQVV